MENMVLRRLKKRKGENRKTFFNIITLVKFQNFRFVKFKDFNLVSSKTSNFFWENYFLAMVFFVC